MVAVRYAALAALVLWIAALLNAHTPLIYGVVVLVCLLTIKFVGPPPPAFIARMALTFLMLAATALALRVVALALGAVLLFWYVDE